MHIEIWRSWERFAFLEPNVWEYALLALEVLLALALLAQSRRDLYRFDRRRMLLLVACLTSSVIFEHLVVVRFSGHRLLPAPGVPLLPAQPVAPLLGMLPVAVAAAWLGPAPALLIGCIKGFVRVGLMVGSVAEPLSVGLYGFALGFLLRQDYHGRLPRLAREPLVALLVALPLPAFMLFVPRFAHVIASGLSGFDYALTLTRCYTGPLLLESVVAAIALQSIYLLRPQWRPVRTSRRWAPYSRTLNRRLLALFVPLIGSMIVILVYAVTATALRLATSEAVEQMARDADRAAEEVPYFLQTGQGLLAELADDEELRRGDANTLTDRLRRGMQMVVFFDQLVLLDSTGELLAYYPTADGEPQLTPRERALVDRVLESGAPETSKVHRSEQGAINLTFSAPMSRDPPDEEAPAVSRVLLGRTRVDGNPVVRRIVNGLQPTGGRGSGFIVDANGRIVAHPNPDRLLTSWNIGDQPSPITADVPGSAYQTRDAQDNTRELVYHVPVEGYPWEVVSHLPYAVVLDQAGQIAAPLLGLQVLLGGGLILVISLATSRLTRPLHHLATAAHHISEGDLRRSVSVEGQDEVARLGQAFERMRLRLRDRMEALSRLLQVSRAVSATLDLAEGMPHILEGALKAMDARVARVVFLDQAGRPDGTMSRGQEEHAFEQLDRVLSRAARLRDGPLVIPNLARARSLFGEAAADSSLGALLAVPVRCQQSLSAVMWIGFDRPRYVDDSDVNLLSALAGQAAVLLENARLFASAEGERRRLALILASTTDAVLVTDPDDRVLLINPAAERAFDLYGEGITGRPVGQIALPGALLHLLRAPLDAGAALTRELVLADDRTLYASVSAILSDDGRRLGRVAVMRDITRLKELDALKSEFLSAVSHDLRSPLTFVRGYTTMLPEVGALNDEQRTYVQNILRGVDQIADLVDDLLDLRRIEEGVGLAFRPCYLGLIVSEAVDARRTRAAAKDVTLRLKLQGQQEAQARSQADHAQPAVVSGDAPSLRQAITNLVDNAIKYTPRGGQVVVTLSVVDTETTHSKSGKRQALVRVSDTGIGIAPEDQVRLFETFYRVRRRDVPGAAGTGLGLSLVKSIVERHHGTVEVDSQLNQGSTFTIRLPLLDDRPRSEAGDED